MLLKKNLYNVEMDNWKINVTCAVIKTESYAIDSIFLSIFINNIILFQWI